METRLDVRCSIKYKKYKCATQETMSRKPTAWLIKKQKNFEQYSNIKTKTMNLNTTLVCLLCLLSASCKKEINKNTVAASGIANAVTSGITAVPASDFDSMFTRYEKGQWTGGDVAYSHILPDGRSFWLFGDSFVDTVFPDRHRPRDAFIHSTIVLTDSFGGFNTLYNGTERNPKPFFEAQEPIQLWPNCAFISKDEKTLYVMIVVIKATGEGGLFGFEVIGNAVGVLSLPDLTLIKTIQISKDPTIDWSSGTYEEGDYVYIYGAESTKYNKFMHLSRTSRSNPFKKMEYYNGTSWVTDSKQSARLISGVSEQYSVFKYANKYYLLSQAGVLLSPDIYLWDAASPDGPFTNKRKVYTTPQTVGNIITYNATVHTEFTKDGQLLIGYCTNSLNGNDIYKNADNYRPYFIRVNNWQ